MTSLKLIALDPVDLEVVSTHLQDAVLGVTDIVWQPRQRRLVIALNRFDWEDAETRDGAYRRRRAALRFERVSSCKCREMTPHDKDVVLNLLAVKFDENEPPSGVVTLYFSGGKALRLEVECLECELADLGPVWEIPLRPAHPEDRQPDA